MTQKIALMLGVFLAFAFLTNTVNVFAVQAIGWSQGWDSTAVTFNAYPASKVTFDTSTPNRLIIQYVVSGTNVPNTVHEVGISIFWPSTSNCLSSFGAITGSTSTSGSTAFLGTLNVSPLGSCVTASRQGQTALLSNFLVGDLKIDGTGAGDLTLTIDNAPAGTYVLEFDFRAGACSVVDGGACLVQLQAPGPTFSVNTATVIILAPAIIPEYPLGLPILAIFMIVAYGLIRRRAKTSKNV